MKNGVFTIDSTSGTTYEDGKYAYASQTADGSDAQVKLVEDETVFNQYMPKNWPGFTSSTNETATLKGNDYTSQWLLQTLPMAQYKRDSSGKVIVDSEGNPTITGYDYQYRLPGAATALLWCVVSSVTPAYSSLFTGDSLILNVSTDTQYNITDISIVFHGKINESYANGQKMYSSCNILSMSIDTTSVGKTVNPHIQKFIENNKASEQAK